MCNLKKISTIYNYNNNIIQANANKKGKYIQFKAKHPEIVEINFAVLCHSPDVIKTLRRSLNLTASTDVFTSTAFQNSDGCKW